MKAPNASGWVKLKDLPPPHKWFFKGTKRKRDVTVKKFICYGYKHVYAGLVECNDVIWDPRDESWKRVEMDLDEELAAIVGDCKMGQAEFDGRKFHNRFHSSLEAEEWVINEAKTTFPPATHRMVSDTYPYGPWKPKYYGKPPPPPPACVKCKLSLTSRGERSTNDWTGGPYCDICSLRSPDYGDNAGLARWKKIRPATARKWKKDGKRTAV